MQINLLEKKKQDVSEHPAFIIINKLIDFIRDFGSGLYFALRVTVFTVCYQSGSYVEVSNSSCCSLKRR